MVIIRASWFSSCSVARFSGSLSSSCHIYLRTVVLCRILEMHEILSRSGLVFSRVPGHASSSSVAVALRFWVVRG